MSNSILTIIVLSGTVTPCKKLSDQLNKIVPGVLTEKLAASNPDKFQFFVQLNLNCLESYVIGHCRINISSKFRTLKSYVTRLLLTTGFVSRSCND